MVVARRLPEHAQSLWLIHSDKKSSCWRTLWLIARSCCRKQPNMIVAAVCTVFLWNLSLHCARLPPTGLNRFSNVFHRYCTNRRRLQSMSTSADVSKSASSVVAGSNSCTVLM